MKEREDSILFLPGPFLSLLFGGNYVGKMLVEKLLRVFCFVETAAQIFNRFLYKVSAGLLDCVTYQIANQTQFDSFGMSAGERKGWFCRRLAVGQTRTRL